MFIARERLMLTEDGKVVREGHPKARRLLVAKGGEVSRQEAEKYGLMPKDQSMELCLPHDFDGVLSLEEVSREPTAADALAKSVPSNIGGTNAASKVPTDPAMDRPPESVNAPPGPAPSISPQPQAPVTAAPKAAAPVKTAVTEAPKGTVPATAPAPPAGK